MDNQNNMPPPATYGVQQDYARKKHNLEVAFKEFHELVLSKVLNSNKSPSLKKVEAQTVENLIKSAQALEMVNVGEGMLSLVTIAIREQLIVRDRVNELEFELCKAIQELEKLKKKASNAPK